MQNNMSNNHHLGYNFDELVPELPKWNDGKGIDITSWIKCVGNYEHAIGYGQIFWPDFIEYEGCVFLSETFSEEAYTDMMNRSNNNKQAMEYEINIQAIFDLFCNVNPSYEQIIYLGRLLKEIWQAKLNQVFLDKKITVELFEKDVEEILDIEITFFQIPVQE